MHNHVQQQCGHLPDHIYYTVNNFVLIFSSFNLHVGCAFFPPQFYRQEQKKDELFSGPHGVFFFFFNKQNKARHPIHCLQTGRVGCQPLWRNAHWKVILQTEAIWMPRLQLGALELAYLSGHQCQAVVFYGVDNRWAEKKENNKGWPLQLVGSRKQAVVRMGWRGRDSKTFLCRLLEKNQTTFKWCLCALQWHLCQGCSFSFFFLWKKQRSQV